MRPSAVWRFTIRELALVCVIAAVCAAWYADRRALTANIVAEYLRGDEIATELRRLTNVGFFWVGNGPANRQLPTGYVPKWKRTPVKAGSASVAPTNSGK
jgi:hypothetical protein